MSQTRTRTVLLVASGPADVQEMIALAHWARAERHLLPILLCHSSDAFRAASETLPIEQILAPSWLGGDPATQPEPGRTRRDGRTLVPGSLRRFVGNLRRLRRVSAEASGLLDQERPVALLVSDDRSFGANQAVLSVARRARVPTVVVPFADSDPASDAYLRQRVPAVHVDSHGFTLVRRFVARLLPGQVQVTPYGRMLFAPVPEILAYGAMGMLPPAPWCMGGGRSDVVAVAGQRDRDRLIACGVEAERIVITGQATLDVLAANLPRRVEVRGRLVSMYRLDPSRPLVICAVPHLGEHALTDWSMHVQLTDQLGAALAQLSASVLLSLHPKSSRSNYERWEVPGRMQIAKQPLREILHASDVFVSTVSSTVRWAAMLSIPTVVFNPLAQPVDAIEGLRPMTVVQDPSDVTTAAERFLRFSEPAHQEPDESLGSLDGQARDRIWDLVERLAGTSP